MDHPLLGAATVWFSLLSGGTCDALLVRHPSFVLFCEAVPAKIAGLSVVGALFRRVTVCTCLALTSGWGEAQQSLQETPHRHLSWSAGPPTHNADFEPSDIATAGHQLTEGGGKRRSAALLGVRVLFAHESGSCSSDLELAELTVSCEIEDDGCKLNASGFGLAEINAEIARD